MKEYSNTQISERLKYIRTYDLHTQEELASVLNVKRATYADWENHRSIIPLKHLNTLSNFYKLSIDYILGLSSKNNFCEIKALNIKKINANFKTIRLDNKLTKVEFANSLHISEGLVRAYENNLCIISTHVAYDLAKKYNISIDWLLGKSNSKFL